MKKFISKIFKLYSYTLGVITPLFILNYIYYKKRMKQINNNPFSEEDVMEVLRGLMKW